MADISIHNVKNVEINQDILDSGTWVCRIYLTCQSPIAKEQFYETITLFTDNKETCDSFIEVNKND